MAEKKSTKKTTKTTKTTTQKAKPQETVKELKVNVLGKGQETVKIEGEETIEDIRDMLALDKDVQAVSGSGRTLTDKQKVNNINSLDFIPNVEGGF